MKQLLESLTKLGEMHDLAVLGHINRKQPTPPVDAVDPDLEQAIKSIRYAIENSESPTAKRIGIKNAIHSLNDALAETERR